MTLPAAGTGFIHNMGESAGSLLEFAEMRHKLFLRTAGRVMTLPYSGRCEEQSFCCFSKALLRYVDKHFDYIIGAKNVKISSAKGRRRSITA